MTFKILDPKLYPQSKPSAQWFLAPLARREKPKGYEVKEPLKHVCELSDGFRLEIEVSHPLGLVTAHWVVRKYDELPIAAIIEYDSISVPTGGIEATPPELMNVVVEHAKVQAENAWFRHTQGESRKS